MGQNPVVDVEWQTYEITGDVAKDAQWIALGCFLSGDGELKVDDIHFYYEHESKWVEIPIGNNNFESDDIGVSLLEKTWVYRGKEYVIGISDKDASEGSRCVSIKKDHSPKLITGKSIFNAHPSIGEHIRKDIGGGVGCMIPLVVYGNAQGTYPVQQAQMNRQHLKVTNVNDFGLQQRLADVVITWNVFQHFYPYFDHAKVDWNAELIKAFNKCYTDKNPADFLVTLQQLTAPLKDGHISVKNNTLPFFTPGIAWEFIEGKLVITRVCDYPGLKVGDVVSSINGINVESYFSQVKSRISSATPGFLSYRAGYMSLRGEKDSRISITLNNKTFELICNKNYDQECDPAFSNNAASIRHIGNDIIYLNLVNTDMKTIDSMLPRLVKSKTLICDFRGYPGSENHELIQYLLKTDDTNNSWMQIPEIIYPDQEKISGYDKSGWLLKAKKPHIKAKVIFITDAKAISYAESWMGFVEAYKLATIVGDTTAGTNGNVNPFVLPGGYEIWWTGMKVVKHNGAQHHGVGIIPDIPVSRTVKGVQEGRDELLEKAIEVANRNEKQPAGK